MGRMKLNNHIVICGWSDMVADVIEQLHAEDVSEPRHIVIIDDKLETCPIDDPYVYLVQGDPTEDATLERASIKTAGTALILADWSLPDPNLRDSKTALITLAIESAESGIYSCAELMRTESKRHLERAGVDEPICVSDLSQKLLVQAALNHGISQFFEDVLTFGEGSEIYKIDTPDALVGRSFREGVGLLSERFGVILLSVERAGPANGRAEIFTNPQEQFELRDGDKLFILAEGGNIADTLGDPEQWGVLDRPGD